MSTHVFAQTGSQEWLVPEPYEAPQAERARGWCPIPCRSCGAAILFCRTRLGKAAPLNPDGSSHFATCTEPARWRKR